MHGKRTKSSPFKVGPLTFSHATQWVVKCIQIPHLKFRRSILATLNRRQCNNIAPSLGVRFMRRSTLGTITTISGDFYERGARLKWPLRLLSHFNCPVKSHYHMINLNRGVPVCYICLLRRAETLLFLSDCKVQSAQSNYIHLAMWPFIRQRPPPWYKSARTPLKGV